jgi:hypothetical protein
MSRDENSEEKPRGDCIGCHTELTVTDDSPNGDYNATCLRCRAEESHDFDREPDVTFTRWGLRIEAPVLKIKSALVYTKGDARVGISGEGVAIKATGDYILDLEHLTPEERKPALEAFRAKLNDAFAEIWDERVNVVFDIEQVKD